MNHEHYVFGSGQLDEAVDSYHFDYIKPDEETQHLIENCRRCYKTLLTSLHTIPPSRERSLAITKLEESLMFATKAIVITTK